MTITTETENIGVYVKTDAAGNITAINSDAFMSDTEGWTKIDEGIGDKYRHAQNCYLEDGLYTDEGTPRYRLVNGEPVEV